MTDSYKGAPSVGENVVSSVKEVLGLNRSKPTVEPPKVQEPTHEDSPENEPEDKPEDEITQLRHTLQSESQQASNAGKQAQSTDHMNQY